MTESKIQAILNLLEDPEDEIFVSVLEEIVSNRKIFEQKLLELKQNTNNLLLQKRINIILTKFKDDNFITNFVLTLMENDYLSIILLSEQFLYPNSNIELIGAFMNDLVTVCMKKELHKEISPSNFLLNFTKILNYEFNFLQTKTHDWYNNWKLDSLIFNKILNPYCYIIFLYYVIIKLKPKLTSEICCCFAYLNNNENWANIIFQETKSEFQICNFMRTVYDRNAFGIIKKNRKTIKNIEFYNKEDLYIIDELVKNVKFYCYNFESLMIQKFNFYSIIFEGFVLVDENIDSIFELFLTFLLSIRLSHEEGNVNNGKNSKVNFERKIIIINEIDRKFKEVKNFQ
ncbi:MAG: hypothetical protein LBV69_02900 [Bacteroidales bacterium]|jgi:hypothetical protein|nr:hypothetical protein [Bacteroidales bacterium]